MLKELFFLSILITGLLAQQEWQQEWFSLVQTCKVERGASDADAALLQPLKAPGNYNAACILACVKKKMNLMNADNTMNIANVLEKMEPIKLFRPDLYPKLEQAIFDCNFPPQSNDCIAAQLFSVCMDNEKQKLGIPL